MQKSTLFLLATFVLLALCDEDTVKIPMSKRALNRDGLMKRREFIEKNAKLNAAKSFNPKFKASKNPRTGRFISTQFPSDYFLIDVDLGTPPQTFQVAVDSFHLSFWVLNTDYSGNVSESQTLYNQTASSTWSEIGDNYYYFYNTGYIFGSFDQDVFALGRLTYATQPFGSISAIYDFFSSYPVDGFIGLGVPAPDDLEYHEMPLRNVADQLKSPSYTIWLGNHVPPSAGTLDGLLTLGGADNVNCLNDYNTVTQFYNDDFWVWLFSVDSVQIGKYQDEVKHFGYINVGSPVISVPQSEFSRILKILNPSYDSSKIVCQWLLQQILELGIYYLPCKDAYEAPDITLTIGGKDYVVPGRNYIVDILGTPFMQAFCTQVDFQNHKVTFSTAKH
ncbi:Peptidase A1 domain-containing protein [Aphelenchoides besseyi]|nr:Peptidase A1 domain-containing protein [Aphelenchoides besseyi]KAI6195204.1 Peptidase A1 domain-containing protein [Aphelenchoides besseyi]